MSQREGQIQGGGMSIASRFGLLMALSLSVVMGAGGFLLLDKSRRALEEAGRHTLTEVANLTAAEEKAHEGVAEALFAEVQAGRMTAEEAAGRLADPRRETYEDSGVFTLSEGVRFQQIQFTDGPGKGQPGYLVLSGDSGVLSPRGMDGGQSDSLFGLILVVTAALVVVGAGVAFLVSSQVTKPIEQLVGDVRTISFGNLHHRTRVRGGGEVFHLARQIDRMAENLEKGQETEIELDKREREREVARKVRESLLPQSKPDVPGYMISDLHVDAAEAGGDFHDYVQSDGKIALLVCEVSGRGVPGALVGATARAYLRSELARGEDLEDALKRINRQIASDVSKGMFVTVLCLVLDPEENVATMACAGHKIPLIRFEASSGQVRLIQPEGIALGLDRGPIFDRSLELLRVPMEPGDRLVLANTGPARVPNSEGVELGEKGLYRIIARNASGTPEEMGEGILTALSTRIDDEEFPADVSLVILGRDA